MHDDTWSFPSVDLKRTLSNGVTRNVFFSWYTVSLCSLEEMRGEVLSGMRWEVWGERCEVRGKRVEVWGERWEVWFERCDVWDVTSELTTATWRGDSAWWRWDLNFCVFFTVVNNNQGLTVVFVSINSRDCSRDCHKHKFYPLGMHLIQITGLCVVT